MSRLTEFKERQSKTEQFAKMDEAITKLAKETGEIKTEENVKELMVSVFPLVDALLTDKAENLEDYDGFLNNVCNNIRARFGKMNIARWQGGSRPENAFSEKEDEMEKILKDTFMELKLGIKQKEKIPEELFLGRTKTNDDVDKTLGGR